MWQGKTGIGKELTGMPVNRDRYEPHKAGMLVKADRKAQEKQFLTVLATKLDFWAIKHDSNKLLTNLPKIIDTQGMLKTIIHISHASINQTNSNNFAIKAQINHSK